MGVYIPLKALEATLTALHSVLTRFELFQRVPHGFHMYPNNASAVKANEEMVASIAWMLEIRAKRTGLAD